MPSENMAPPVGGWNTFDALADMDPSFAPVMDNMLPEGGAVKVRAGYRTWARGMPGPVGGLMVYNSATRFRMFASSRSAIYDVSSPGVVAGPVVSGLSNGRWDGITIAAAGGQFLLAYNGFDQARQFDGMSWSVWTGSGVDVAVGWANVFKTQPYVGNAGKMSFYYGVPAAIGGAFVEFPLQGVAKKGGGVCGMQTWTLDGGQGIDDYAVFFTTEGEVVVYRGTNPSSSTTWALVGTFQMSRPLPGTRFARQFGGDVLLLTEGGVFSLRVLLSGVDAGALASKAYTRRIEPTFLGLTRTRRAQFGWDLVPLPSYGMWLVNVPRGTGDAEQVAFRAASGAAARFVALPAACWIEAKGRAFFGHAADGRVLLWGEDVSDNGASITSETVAAFSTFNASGVVKQFTLAEPVLDDAAGAAVAIEVATDWAVPPRVAFLAGPSAPPVALAVDQSILIWGIGKWGVGKWAGSTGAVSRGWRGVRGIGQSGAVRLRMSSVSSRPGWLSTGLVWQSGGPLR